MNTPEITVDFMDWWNIEGARLFAEWVKTPLPPPAGEKSDKKERWDCKKCAGWGIVQMPCPECQPKPAPDKCELKLPDLEEIRNIKYDFKLFYCPRPWERIEGEPYTEDKVWEMLLKRLGVKNES